MDPLFVNEFSRQLGETFHQHGEGLYLVGGYLRDLFLDRDNDDLDYATSASPDETYDILWDWRGQVENLSFYCVPYEVGTAFGTVGASIVFTEPSSFQHLFKIEVTTFRINEKYDTGNRKPTVQWGETIFDDLGRRDFTINAMARDCLTGDSIDPHGGHTDLKSALVRAVGNPDDRFLEDPLRILRAARFAAQLGFTIESNTLKAIENNAKQLNHISKERIAVELTKLIKSKKGHYGYEVLWDSYAIKYCCPLLDYLPPGDFSQNLFQLSDNILSVWAKFLLPVRKSYMSGIPENLPRDILLDLRFPNHIIDGVIRIHRNYDKLFSYHNKDNPDAFLRRIIRDLGPNVESALQILLSGKQYGGQFHWDVLEYDKIYEDITGHIKKLGGVEYIQSLDSPLSGDELMQRYNRLPGPWIKEVKDKLLDAVLDGNLEVDDKIKAREIADKFLKISV